MQFFITPVAAVGSQPAGYQAVAKKNDGTVMFTSPIYPTLALAQTDVSQAKAYSSTAPVHISQTTTNFAAQTIYSLAGVTVYVSGINPNQQFSFSPLSSFAGTPTNMNVFHAGVMQMVINFPSSYTGLPFVYTDANGVAHNGTFAEADFSYWF